jgi:hypothetical protein
MRAKQVRQNEKQDDGLSGPGTSEAKKVLENLTKMQPESNRTWRMGIENSAKEQGTAYNVARIRLEGIRVLLSRQKQGLALQPPRDPLVDVSNGGHVAGVSADDPQGLQDTWVPRHSSLVG